MIVSETETKNRKFSRNKEKNIRLEEILNQRISLDTDVMDFLLIAGWSGYCRSLSPLYRKVEDRFGEDIRKRILERRENLSMSQKLIESRFCLSLLHIGYGEEFKTLGELKPKIEEAGIKIRNIGYKTLAHFDKTLKGHGIESFKIGVKGRKYAPAELRKLKKYGLEPAEKN